MRNFTELELDYIYSKMCAAEVNGKLYTVPQKYADLITTDKMSYQEYSLVLEYVKDFDDAVREFGKKLGTPRSFWLVKLIDMHGTSILNYIESRILK